MYQKYRTVVELKNELDRQRDNSWDTITPSGNLRFVPNQQSLSLSINYPSGGDGDLMAVQGIELPLNDWAKRNVCQKLDFPWSYYRKCENFGKYQLLADNLNTWLNEVQRNLLVRTLDNEVRAVLSDSYMFIDNVSVLLTALQTFQEKEKEWNKNIVLWRSDLSDTAMHIKAGLEREIHLTDTEVVYPGILLENSEVGASYLRVRPALLNPSCKNVMASVIGFEVKHLGKQRGIGVIQWSDRTRQFETEAIKSKVIDCVTQGFAPEFFGRWVNAIKRGIDFQLECEREVAVEALKIEFGVGESEGEKILDYFSNEKRTLYGLGNAVTRYAQDVDPDRAVELEIIGGRVAITPVNHFDNTIKQVLRKRDHERETDTLVGQMLEGGSNSPQPFKIGE